MSALPSFLALLERGGGVLLLQRRKKLCLLHACRKDERASPFSITLCIPPLARRERLDLYIPRLQGGEWHGSCPPLLYKRGGRLDFLPCSYGKERALPSCLALLVRRGAILLLERRREPCPLLPSREKDRATPFVFLFWAGVRLAHCLPLL